MLADRQVAAVLMAAGADIKLPTVHEQRALFDAALVEELEPQTEVDSEQMELRRALGVA